MSSRSVGRWAGSIAAFVVALGMEPSLGLAADGGAGDGGSSCSTTNECGPPNPYCSPTLGRCVQCVGDANCRLGPSDTTSFCDEPTGLCWECGTHADCTADYPYCSPTLRYCVQCLADANCRASTGSGTHCSPTIGQCVSCVTDSHCGPGEQCAPDGWCEGRCPFGDLGSSIGSAVASGSTVGMGVLYTDCSSGPAASFSWTAPSEGYFTFDTLGSSFDTVLSVYPPDCSGFSLACNDDYFAGPSLVEIYLTQGQRVSVIVGGYGSSVGNYVLNVASGGGGGIEGGVPTYCGDGYRDFNEQCDGPNLSGATCAAVTMNTRPVGVLLCTPFCTYDTTRCTGGVGGAFGGGGMFGGGAGTPGAAGRSGAAGTPGAGGRLVVRDAGAGGTSVCSPGEESACTCGGGVEGVWICTSDGRRFGRCECPTGGGGRDDGGANRASATEPDGCGCAVPGRNRGGAAPFVGLGIGLLLVSRRRWRRRVS